LVAQRIADLAVDITAQSVGQLGVDLQAESIGSLSVELVAESIGSLPVDISAQSISEVDIDLSSQSLSNLTVELAAESIGSLPIDIDAQTVSQLAIDIESQTVNLLDTAVESRREESILFQTVQTSTTVPANGGTDSITIRAPAGTILEVIALELRVSPPAGATTGTHFITVRSEQEFVDLLSGEADNVTTLAYDSNVFGSANVSQSPSSDAGQVQAVQGARIDENNGLEVAYTNNTGTASNRTRTVRLWAREVAVA
jgi:hypothetical protein